MTITRAFGFTLDTQTGAVEQWAAGDPASVAEHLPIAQDDGIGFNGEDPRCAKRVGLMRTACSAWPAPGTSAATHCRRWRRSAKSSDHWQTWWRSASSSPAPADAVQMAAA